MKTAIYLENGTTQLILTPEDEFEKDVMARVLLDKRHMTILEGEFYECRGGFVRQGPGKQSLIFRFGTDQ